MKYLTSISEQELSAYLIQTEQVVAVQQKKARLQVIAFFCAIVLLGSVALLQMGVIFPALWAVHSHAIIGSVLLGFVAIIFASAFVSSQLHSEQHKIEHDPKDTHKIHYDIDLNDEGLYVTAAAEQSQETTQYFWRTIKKVYLFNHGIMILGYGKAKESLLLPFNEPALQPAMQHLVDEMRMHLPASIFVVG